METGRSGVGRIYMGGPTVPASQSLRGYWRPEELPSSGACTTWSDASGLGHDFTVDGASSANPNVDTVTTLNGYRSLKFTPNSARDSMSAGPVLAECVEAASIFYLVMRHTNATNNATAGAPMWSEIADAAASHWPFTNGLTYDRNLRDRNHRTNDISLGSWTGQTVLVQISTSVADDYKMRIDGSVVRTASHRWVDYSTSPGTQSDVMDQLQIGGNDANGFLGHPANYWEILAYDAVPTDAERFEIHDYLNDKYALSLPTS